MKYLTTSFSLLLLAQGAVFADFRTSQSADLVIGGSEPAGTLSAADIAVDASTQKVFVADDRRHRVLRFSSQAALQNGGLAEAVFGQPDMIDQSAGTSSVKLKAPSGVCIDAGGRLWVADTGNNRVLRFDSALTAPSGIAASVVFGQPNFTTSIADVGGNRMKSPQDVEMDSTGHLWVADTQNNRVLRFDNAANRSTGVSADSVLGQNSLGVSTPGTSQTQMYSPTGLALESSGPNTVRMWVVDWYNNRVIGFTNPVGLAYGAAADKLLGQIQWTSGAAGGGANRFNRPLKAGVDGTSLWVADFNNHRALHFANAATKSIGGFADLVLGQLDYNSTNPVADAGFLLNPTSIAAAGGRVWIGDLGNRIVRHDSAATKGNGTDADGILGRRSFAPSYLGSPTDIVVDGASGKVFVADPATNRVLRYASTSSLDADSSPEAVLGQPDLNTWTAGTSASRMSGPSAVVLDALGNLWVADAGNNRVLRFANAVTAPSGAAAAQVLGQLSFTTRDNELASNGMSNPAGLATEWAFNATFQIVVRRLWVADRGFNRILRFENPLGLGNGGAASGVLGAPNLGTMGGGTVSANRFDNPRALAVDLNGRLWVADSGNNRVLRFDSAAGKANNANADGVLFQPNFTTTTSLDGASVGDLSLGLNGRLYATRSEAIDLAWFDNAAAKTNGAAPDGTLGDPTRINSLPGRCAAVDASGRLWTGYGSQLMRFTPALESRITGAAFNQQNRFTLTILGEGGETYSIRSSTDLKNWGTIENTTTVPGSGPQVLTWTAAAPPSGPQKYYRLQAQ